MKKKFLLTPVLAALFIAPLSFSNAFAACDTKAQSDCACKAECCHHEAGKKVHKCKKECKCPCCADKTTAEK